MSFLDKLRSIKRRLSFFSHLNTGVRRKELERLGRKAKNGTLCIKYEDGFITTVAKNFGLNLIKNEVATLYVASKNGGSK